MKIKIIVASVVILAALGFGAISFVETNVEYADFQTAIATHKKMQVKGSWVQEKPSAFDPSKAQFSFFMVDESGREMKVVYDGARPNNFELAASVVVKGRCQEDYFHASEILTKCPSKYEGNAEAVKNSL